MAGSNQELSARVTSKGAAMVPSGFEHNVKMWYAENRKRILALVGGDESKAALFVASAFAQVNRIPKLLECDPNTFFNCLLFSMGTNLYPGPMQECVYIPFGNQATFVPQYQGLVKLAYNSGFLTRIGGHVVWEADEFDYDPALEVIHHRPFRGPENKRGERVAAYITLKNRYGEVQPTVRYAEFIEGIKARSKAAKSADSPWNSKYPSDVDAMWLKTLFKQATKWMPKSASPVGMQMARAIELDNQADSDTTHAQLLTEELDHVQREVMDIKPQQTKTISNETMNFVKNQAMKPVPIEAYVDRPIEFDEK